MPVAWSQRVHDDMARAAATVDEGELWSLPEFYRARGLEGALHFMGVQIGGQYVGTLAIAAETTQRGRELVIVAAGSDRPDFDLVKTIMPHVEDLAQSWACKSVRFHTLRPGLARKMEGQGYHKAEWVYRKWLS